VNVKVAGDLVTPVMGLEPGETATTVVSEAQEEPEPLRRVTV
jgi:hypothetical protein